MLITFKHKNRPVGIMFAVAVNKMHTTAGLPVSSASIPSYQPHPPPLRQMCGCRSRRLFRNHMSDVIIALTHIAVLALFLYRAKMSQVFKNVQSCQNCFNTLPMGSCDLLFLSKELHSFIHSFIKTNRCGCQCL